MPEEERSLPSVLAIKRKYTMMYIAVFIVGLVIGLAVYVRSAIFSGTIFNMTLCIQLIGVVISMGVCRRNALQFKIAQQWAIPAEATSKVADLKFRGRPIEIHNRYFLIYLLIDALGVGTVIFKWDSIPATFVWHTTLGGTAHCFL